MDEQGDGQGENHLVEQELVQQEHAEQAYAHLSTVAAIEDESGAYTEYQQLNMSVDPAAAEYLSEQQDQPQQDQRQQLLPGQEGDETCNSGQLVRREVPDILCPGGAVVRNRGALIAAAMQRQQAQQLTQQQLLMQEWQGFASRQVQRHVPAPPSASRRTVPESVCYRLRVMRIDNVPAPQHSGGTMYGLQLGVTLYDEALGQFFGNTCYSMVEPLRDVQQQEQEQEQGHMPDTPGEHPSVGFSCDVMFNTVISDPHCMAVVELILVEMEGDDGSCRTKSSAGWAQVPLFTRKGPAPGLLSKQAQLPGGQTPATAPLMCGTPRYLQLRAVCGDQLAPPAVLGSCKVAYQVEAFPAMNPARPLLPQDFLVSYTDVIPGLVRFNLEGQPTTALHSCLNTLASPVLAPLAAVACSGVQLVVPQLLHNLLSVLPELLGTVPPPDLASMLSVPCQPEAVSYAIRLRAHNGRTYVGPWVTTQLQVRPHLGSLVLSPVSGQVPSIDWLLQDKLIMLVFELLAEPTATAAAEAEGSAAASVGTVLVGRSLLAPFTDVAGDGSSAILAEGRHKLLFDSTSCVGSLSSSSCWAAKGCSTSLLAAGSAEGSSDLLLPLNWRALLRDTATRYVPDPALQLQLHYSDRAPQAPEAVVAVQPAAAAKYPQGFIAMGLADTTVQPGAGPQPYPEAAAAAAAASVHAAYPPAAAERSAPAAPPAMQLDTVTAAVAAVHIQESPAARSLKLAAQHLEEAANIPVLTPSSTTNGGRESLEAVDNQADTASRQQLQQLAEAMQQQLDMLAHAVSELRQERQTLRSSLTLLESAAQPATSSMQPGSRSHQQAAEHADSQQQVQRSTEQQFYQHNRSSVSRQAAADLSWVTGVPEAVAGDWAGFSGQVQHEAYQGLQPSRAVLQQLHEAGMTYALPADVQASLQAQSALMSNPRSQQNPLQHKHQGDSSRMAALQLDIEARDPRTASQIVLQLLAFRPAGQPAAALKLPSNLSRMYFTLQFYKCGPVVTEPCMLAATPGSVQSAQHPAHTGGTLGLPGAQHQDARGTFVLLPQQHSGSSSTPAGAGLVLKFSLDGSRPSDVLPGQDLVQAAAQAHLAFCKYLVSHKLSVDVWDADSLLQIGSCTTDLSGMLRQGKDLSDLLLELPLLKDCSHDGTGPASALASGAGQSVQPQQQQQQQQGRTQLGTLVLRLINIGQEPRHSSICTGMDTAAAAAAPGTPGRKVCVRAAPLQPGSPVAKELRAGSTGGSSGPFAVDWRQHPGSSNGSSGGATADGGVQDADVSVSMDAAATAADIIGFEHRKLAREQRLKDLLHSPSSSPTRSSPGSQQWRGTTGQHSPAGRLAATWNASSPTKGHHQQQLQQQQRNRPGSPMATLMAAEAGGDVDAAEPFKALQQQLMSDVDAVRKRQKPGFIRSQLRKSLVTQCTIRPCPGQALLLHHTLTNTMGRDAVFELRVSHPLELSAVESLQLLRDLQHSVGAGISTAAAACGGSGSTNHQIAAGANTASPLKLRQLAQQAEAAGGANNCHGKQLVNQGRIFLAANESLSVPLRFMLQLDQPSSTSNGGVFKQSNQQQQQQQQQQEHTVVVDFVPLGLDWPLSILELSVQPQAAVVDRTLRYHCPERELLHVELPLSQLPGASAALAAAAAAGKLSVCASRADVSVSVISKGPQQAAGDGPTTAREQQQQQQEHYVCLRYRCGAAHEAVQLFVWLYADAAMAQPLESWQVFVNVLQRVDMRATVGQQSSTTLAISGGASDRLVAAYSSQPGELQATPATLSLPAGGIAALGLVVKPRFWGHQRVLVHLVDVNTHQLVLALLVCTEVRLPPLHRQLEVTVRAGSVSQHQLEVSNTSSRAASYVATTNAPWMLSVTPSLQQIPAGGRRMLSLVFDARQLTTGATEDGLVFVNDAHDSLQHEECVVVTVHVA